jgi:5'-3' exonuclease
MGMFDEVEERLEETGLAIDADSLLFKACYKYREDFNIEMAYMEFCKRVGIIERACYDEVAGLMEVIICFSTRKCFRHTVLDTYKANRGKNSTPEGDLLREHTKQLKLLVVDRLKPMVDASNVFEADDLVIQYADKGYLCAALDKDVLNATKTKCFNYDTNKWTPELSEMEINRWYILQSIMGDTADSIVGVKGMGKVKAEAFVEALFNGEKTFDDYVELFTTPEDCLVTNQLVRMNQYEGKKLKLATMEDVLQSIYPF